MCSKAKSWKSKDWKHNALPMCDGGKCRGYRGTLIKVPLEGGASVLLCKACYETAVVA